LEKKKIIKIFFSLNFVPKLFLSFFLNQEIVKDSEIFLTFRNEENSLWKKNPEISIKFIKSKNLKKEGFIPRF